MKVDGKLRSYLSNVESLPSIQRLEKEVQKVDDDIQKFEKITNATKVVVGAHGVHSVDLGCASKDFYVNNELKSQERHNKKWLFFLAALIVTILTGIALVIVFAVLPLVIKSSNKNSDLNNLSQTSTPFSSQPSSSPTTPLFGSYSTSQSQIVDGYSNPVRLSGLNWYGFAGSAYAPPELSSESYRTVIDNVKVQGFNSIRIPFSSEMLAQSSPAPSINVALNSDLAGLTPLECLDKVIQYCGSVGLRVVLSRHSCKAGNFDAEVLWYIPGDSYFTEAQFLADWVLLARRYANSAVIAVDLWDQPRALATWGPPSVAVGAGAGAGLGSVDWKSAAQSAGNLILAENPNLLIVVQGLLSGTDLQAVAAGQALSLSVPGKVVYAVHVSAPENPSSEGRRLSTLTPDDLRSGWTASFGFFAVMQQYPVYVVEVSADESSAAWLSEWVRYCNGDFLRANVSDLLPGQVGLSWSFSANSTLGNVVPAAPGTPSTPTGLSVSPELLSVLRAAQGPPVKTFNPAATSKPSVAPAQAPSGRPRESPTQPPSQTPSASGSGRSSFSPRTARTNFPTSQRPSSSPLQPTAVPSTSRPTFTASALPSASPTLVPIGYLHTSGGQIAGREGQAVRITGVTWSGFESAASVPQGLWVRNYKALLSQVKGMGFNTVRLPFCNQMLASNDSIAAGVDFSQNPDLVGLSALEFMDKIINYAGSIGLRVILVRYSAKADNFYSESSWFIPGDAYYTEQLFIADWVMLASRYVGYAVIGAELWQQPRGTATWGTGASTDWDLAATRAGNAILAANPNWLILVQGLAWGVNLQAVATKPIVLAVKNRLVYSAVQFTNDPAPNPWFTAATFPKNLIPLWNQNYGFIVQRQIAPVMVSEFGTNFKYPTDYTWLPLFLNYTAGHYTSAAQSDLLTGHLGMSWCYFSLNPDASVGGVLQQDWTTPEPGRLSFLKPFLAAPFQNIDPNVPLPPVNPNATLVIPNPTIALTQAPTAPTFTYFRTSGNQIVDRMGSPVRFTAVNWLGFETASFIAQGLWTRDYKQLLSQMKTLGFNSVRISFCQQALLAASGTNGIDTYLNPDLAGLKPLQCLDRIVAYCGLVGLRVILVRTSAKADNFFSESSWFIPGDAFYTEAQFIADWVMLAGRYAGTAVVGADLWEQPRGMATWGTGAGTDWDLAATRAGNAILAANPNWLIFVEGIEWGSNLQAVGSKPVRLSRADRVVYAVVQYSADTAPNTLFSDPTFPANLRPSWNSNFGFIVLNQIAPVMVSEFGTDFKYPSDYTWLPLLLNYTAGHYTSAAKKSLPAGHLGMSWAFEALNPSSAVGGILSDADWATADYQKLYYLSTYFAPPFAAVDPGLPLPVPDPNATQVYPNPTFTLTSAPTSPVITYFYTSGNQIVDRSGATVQFTGVNWYGFDGTAFIPQGLWVRGYRSLLDQAKALGFNLVRLPFSGQMLRDSSVASGINGAQNPDLVGLTPLQCMDKIVAYGGLIGLRVLLVRASSKANNLYNEDHWSIAGDSYYTAQRFVQDWVMLAQRYRGSAVIGADLWEQPRGLATWGTGNSSTDWDLFAAAAGNAILAANPDWLVVVEGVNWGCDLFGVRSAGVQLTRKNKLVYGVAQYSNDLAANSLFSAADFPNNLRGSWNAVFGYIVLNQIAPVMVVEFGTGFQKSTDYTWLPLLMNYTSGQFFAAGQSELPAGHKGMSWVWQALNAGNGLGGGLLASDWTSVDYAKLYYLQPFLAGQFQNPDPAQPLPPANWNASWLAAYPSQEPSMAPTAPVFSYYHTRGNQIVDQHGRSIRWSGINWYGAEGVGNIPQGLWARNWKSLIDQTQSLGFNAFRIPYSNEMLRDDAFVSGVWWGINPDLVGLTPLQCLDKIVEYCGQVGMHIILDRHSSQSDRFTQESYWYVPGDPYYTEQRFIDDWVMLARRYRNTAIVAADLWNEPKMNATWGSGDLASDWRLAAERVGNAIQAVNPDWLLVVEGVGGATWWGGDLTKAGDFPVRFKIPNKLVYSVHEYCEDVSEQKWFTDPKFPASLRTHWDTNFGYLLRRKIAPVYVGEYGTRFAHPKDLVWLPRWVNYTQGEYTQDGVNDLLPGETGLSWTFWALSPGGDTGGILESDWKTPDLYKLSFIRKAMAPMLPTYDPPIPGIGVNYSSSSASSRYRVLR